MYTPKATIENIADRIDKIVDFPLRLLHKTNMSSMQKIIICTTKIT